MHASYNLTTDRLHLNPGTKRLPEADYQAAKSARFQWWPGSKQFVAKWSPEAEDFIIDRLGLEIEQNDTPDNLEARVERFQGYAERAEETADSRREYLETRANTERRVRLAKGVLVREIGKAQHWQQRIEAAVRHAQYLEKPDVIARRIKGLEADERKYQRSSEGAEIWLRRWNRPDTSPEWKTKLVNTDYVSLEGGQSAYDAFHRGTATFEEIHAAAIAKHERTLKAAQRWTEHLGRRLEYERALLAAAGGLPSDNQTFEIGGAIMGGWQARDGFAIISKVNKATIEIIKRHYDGKSVRHKVPITSITNVLTAAEVAALPDPLFGADLVKPKPARTVPAATAPSPAEVEPEPSAAAELAERVHANRTGQLTALRPQAQNARVKAAELAKEKQDAKAGSFRAAKQAELQARKIPGFFPTPVPVVARMIEEAGITEECSVLEPSAGMGHIVEAVRPLARNVFAIELNWTLYEELQTQANGPGAPVAYLRGDFLEWHERHPDAAFDRVLMNPPFERGQDVRHVMTAYEHIKPGGRLVAIMGEGAFFRTDSQAREFRLWLDAIGGTSERLPSGSFSTSGTGTETRLVVIEKADVIEAEPVATERGQLLLF